MSDGKPLPPARRPIAVVVFSGTTQLAWLKHLKPGFRHCFIAIEDGATKAGRWILYDPLCHRTDISIIDEVPLWQLVAWYAGDGNTVVPCVIDIPPRRAAPWGPYSCVEAIKRVLGIHARWVITPWNLYNFLINKKK